ncbi:MAG TPA: molybdenum cofactor guanylyltransferase [Chthonomonadales bacterium]|nr:molybdenum cofactor guanylyltransferase [Chthonomonadales bacterium]
MTGIVLAGGKSRRMGRDKALLPFRGKTLLEYVVAQLRKAVDEVIVVADVPNRYVLANGTHVVGDIYPGAGPLGGIVTGLYATEEGYHPVIGCDMPHLEPAILHFLIREAQGLDGAIPVIAGRVEPLCAVYHSRCAAVFEKALHQGERAVHRVIECVDMMRVHEEALRAIDKDLRSFINLNTPEEYMRESR